MNSNPLPKPTQGNQQFSIIVTADGSNTLALAENVEHYHSTHGAISESLHIFIRAGLHELNNPREVISIFEMGFGTGLNALLTLAENKGFSKIHYTAVELCPLSAEISIGLNYPELLNNSGLRPVFELLHSSAWNVEVEITPNFSIHKIHADIKNLELPSNHFDLIYFDAFAPWFTPECWTEDVFKKMFDTLKLNGILVTYSSKGDVKRALKSSGFVIEKLPGPVGKREFVRGVKS